MLAIEVQCSFGSSLRPRYVSCAQWALEHGGCSVALPNLCQGTGAAKQLRRLDNQLRMSCWKLAPGHSLNQGWLGLLSRAYLFRESTSDRQCGPLRLSIEMPDNLEYVCA